MQKIANEALGRMTPTEYASAPKLPIIALLDNIRSANNVGSFFRTADAFGIEKLVLCGITATPPSKEIHKTALSAELVVQWQHYENPLDAICELKAQGYTIIAIEQVYNSVSLSDFKIETDQKYVLVFGNEVDGVADEVVAACDAAIEIPQRGTKHSLNVSVAAGVVLWEVTKNI